MSTINENGNEVSVDGGGCWCWVVKWDRLETRGLMGEERSCAAQGCSGKNFGDTESAWDLFRHLPSET